MGAFGALTKTHQPISDILHFLRACKVKEQLTPIAEGYLHGSPTLEEFLTQNLLEQLKGPLLNQQAVLLELMRQQGQMRRSLIDVLVLEYDGISTQSEESISEGQSPHPLNSPSHKHIIERLLDLITRDIGAELLGLLDIG